MNTFIRTQPRVRFFTRIVVPVVILGSAATLLIATAWNALSPVAEARVSIVAVIPSTGRATTVSSGGIQAPGWIEPRPFAFEVTPLREGVVTEVLVLEGDHVEKGQVVARLESRAQALALARAEGELRAAQGDVMAAEAESIAASRALELQLTASVMLADAKAKHAGADAMLLALAAEVIEARAMRDESQDELTRKSKLLALGGASDGEIRRLTLRVEALTAAMDAKECARVGQIVERDASAVALSAAETSRRELLMERAAAARAQGMFDAAQGMRTAKHAMRDEAALMLERSDVVATVTGIVMQRLAIPGTMVGGVSEASAKPIMLLYDPAQLQVRCDVPLKDAAKLTMGATAEIRVDSLQGKIFTGEVTRLVPLADLQKNTVQCKVAIHDPDPSMRPDMLARVRISLSADSTGSVAGESVAIPTEALRTSSAGGTEVLVAIPHGDTLMTERRIVVLGNTREGGWVEVESGLAAGDRVVLDGNIEAGKHIRGIESLKGEAP